MLVVCSSHPVVLHHLSQVVNQSELLWIHLMVKERDFLSAESETDIWRQVRGMTSTCFLTALLFSFLMVDLPHRALTPSTATAKRKFDSGWPLCSLSSFINAPTTSLLLFTRDMPYSKGNSTWCICREILKTEIATIVTTHQSNWIMVK